jgi:hypothetical protein
MPRSALRINVPTVVHETIDDETIIIHLGTGAYYSLEGCGAEVWTLLDEGDRERDEGGREREEGGRERDEGGRERDEIVSAIQGRYQSDPGLVERAVLDLLDQLLAEGVVVEAEAARAPVVPPVGHDPSGGDPFQAPVLHKYTDIQEFMLVDPLHEVDEHAGWPHAHAG